ncbi:hypothetical protein M752DRAFT_294745 [Aspergillus phoenicis ATCC 13157]|uniref:Xylanolytic transcriptional activator regulatory domain-containing protein n=1 Tax=Aspergillus phoenicis ATCC 13157 TaxID=1353007 RepID=A0A370PFV7_ASPPH|nr:hypothetical protein M752DRAFT_294745 [Aspergillus phoenicis ATCC 13157]
MIFAIGCQCSRAVSGRADGDYDDLVYLNRARKLALGDTVIFEHANLQQIQLDFLIALFFLSKRHINRAFTFSSMAFRSAVLLGINLRFMDDRTQYPAKEARIRLWWLIFLLEHLLTAITGRVSGTDESPSATPLPIPFEEESFGRSDVSPLLQESSLRMNRLKPTLLQTDEEARASISWQGSCEPSPSLFIHCIVDLVAIGQNLINKVYIVQGIRDGASQVEQRIRKYDSILDIWLSKVPEAYRFTSIDGDPVDIPGENNTPWRREHISLAMSYYSIRIMLCRLCLTHRRPPLGRQTPDPAVPQSSRPNSRCNFGCRTQLHIMWLATTAPWWCILHYIMQATTAILLHLYSWPSELSEHPAHNVAFDLQIMTCVIKKALRWLHHMAYKYAVSQRAFRQCNSIVRRIAPVLRIDLSGLSDSEDLPSDGDSPHLGGGIE